MDRFEGVSALIIVNIKIIYIPVWIDLKLLFFHRLQLEAINLHSSMDRFEAVYKNHFAKLVEIYIPVWIDLKM